MIERYQCCRCGNEFQAPAGPTTCPSCSHTYVKWLTYNQNFKDCDGEPVQKVVPLARNLKGLTHYVEVRHGYDPIRVLHKEFKSEEEALAAVNEMREELGLKRAPSY